MASGTRFAPKDLFNSPHLSDVTIHQIKDNQTTKYYGHRAILACHSAWFSHAFSGNFKESSEATIEVHDDDPKTFRTMLEHLYDSEKTDDKIACQMLEKDASLNIADNLVLQVNAYFIAEKYMVTTLASKAAMAFQLLAKDIKIQDLAAAITAYYDNCVSHGADLGKVISSAVLNRSTRDWRTSPATFEDLTTRYPIFAVDMCHQMQRERRFPVAKTLECRECGEDSLVESRDISKYPSRCTSCGYDQIFRG
ncbi:hypothetical protein P154DRAFT_575536 [Amniculicola lignicola CBS 123094]|uniref:BTB domain-containing protein n=1 Tax=Amniculicola lignicola CBS 123094 TaxID=1392246 RepID=A0A6A5WP32_9PLEO|nr:hypothetical protein P154DRAFT_575536 [Amniculicola lignicola CBS 123094]